MGQDEVEQRITQQPRRHRAYRQACENAFDEGEDDLFALSLDDVMSDRPWTADELMGGGARPTSAKPAPSATPAPASVPADDFATRPIVQTTRKAAPAPRPASDPSETAAFLAAAAQCPTANSTIRHAAPQQSAYTLPSPSSSRPSWIWMIFPTASLPLIPGRRQIWTRPRAACRRSTFR